MPCFYLTPNQDDFNQELQVCISEALYDVGSIVADPGAYTRKELALQPVIEAQRHETVAVVGPLDLGKHPLRVEGPVRPQAHDAAHLPERLVNDLMK